RRLPRRQADPVGAALKRADDAPLHRLTRRRRGVAPGDVGAPRIRKRREAASLNQVVAPDQLAAPVRGRRILRSVGGGKKMGQLDSAARIQETGALREAIVRWIDLRGVLKDG